MLNLNYHYTTCTSATPDHAMVLIHGFMGSPSDWDNLRHYYQQRYNCLTIEIPGHHTRPSDATITSLHHLSFSTLSHEIYQLIVGLKLTQIQLIGYSMGGRICMHFSHHYPQFIKQLIILSSNMGYASPKEKVSRLSSDLAKSRVIQTTKWSDFVDYWYGQPLFSELKRSPFFNPILNKRRQLIPNFMSQVVVLLSSAKHPYYPPILNTLPFPVDYIYGKHDTKYAKHVDDNQWPFRCTGIDDADHALHITHAGEVSLFLDKILIT